MNEDLREKMARVRASLEEDKARMAELEESPASGYDDPWDYDTVPDPDPDDEDVDVMEL